MLERLQSIFRKVFEDENLSLRFETNESDIKMWDSLTHLQLIAEIESEFKMKFTFRQMMEAHSVLAILTIVEGS